MRPDHFYREPLSSHTKDKTQQKFYLPQDFVSAKEGCFIHKKPHTKLQKTFALEFCISLSGLWPASQVPQSLRPKGSAWRARHQLRAVLFFLPTRYQTQLSSCCSLGILSTCKNVLHSVPLRNRSAQILFTFRVFILINCFNIQSYYDRIHKLITSDKTSVLNRKSNKLPLLTWACSFFWIQLS